MKCCSKLWNKGFIITCQKWGRYVIPNCLYILNLVLIVKISLEPSKNFGSSNTWILFSLENSKSSEALFPISVLWQLLPSFLLPSPPTPRRQKKVTRDRFEFEAMHLQGWLKYLWLLNAFKTKHLLCIVVENKHSACFPGKGGTDNLQINE